MYVTTGATAPLDFCGKLFLLQPIPKTHVPDGGTPEEIHNFTFGLARVNISSTTELSHCITISLSNSGIDHQNLRRFEQFYRVLSRLEFSPTASPSAQLNKWRSV